jgi:hypothetical protein
VTAGRLFVEPEGGSSEIELEVTSWAETAATFRVPDVIGPVPFASPGRLYIEREDGEQDSVSITVEPTYKVYFYQVIHSDHGREIEEDLTPFSYKYRITLEVDSAELPEEYRLCEDPMTDVPGLATLFANLTWYDSPWAEDEPGSMRLTSGPYVRDGKLHAQLKIEDDWYWDYVAFVAFLIETPLGYSIPSGWTGYSLQQD